MLSLTDYLIASFATYYLALSVSREEGPFAIFLKLRDHFQENDWIGRGVRCIVCMSCWSALLWTVMLCLLGHADPWDWPIVWLGLAGASVVIDRYWKR